MIAEQARDLGVDAKEKGDDKQVGVFCLKDPGEGLSATEGSEPHGRGGEWRPDESRERGRRED